MKTSRAFVAQLQQSKQIALPLRNSLLVCDAQLFRLLGGTGVAPSKPRIVLQQFERARKI